MALDIKKIGNYTLQFVPQVEYVNPIEFDCENRLDSELANLKLLISLDPELSKAPKAMAERVIHKVAVKNFLKSWEENYNEVMDSQFPDNYFSFLLSKKRKQQNKILEKHKLDICSMQAIFYRAWIEYDFSFSSYTFERKPKSFQNRKFPELYYLQSDNTLDIIGETDLSEGELKSVLAQRNVVLARFLDKGKIWHCFLHTYNSITGKEIGKKPHIHYISSAFGTHISREGVLKELRKGRYDLPPMIHIPYDEKWMDEFPIVPATLK